MMKSSMPQGLNLSGKWQVELILFLCLHFKQANMTVFGNDELFVCG